MGAPAETEPRPLSPQAASALTNLMNGFVMAMSRGYAGPVQADVSIPFLRFFANKNINATMQAGRACGLTIQLNTLPSSLLWKRFRIVVRGPVDDVLAFLVQLRQIAEEGAA